MTEPLPEVGLAALAAVDPYDPQALAARLGDTPLPEQGENAEP